MSGGYQNEYEKGFVISGLDTKMEDTVLFHSGTKEQDGQTVTNGGRIVCATALDKELDEALSKSRDLVEAIEFDGKYFSRDIGFEFIEGMSSHA